MAGKHVKRCAASLVIWEWHVKHPHTALGRASVRERDSTGQSGGNSNTVPRTTSENWKTFGKIS